MPLDASIPLSYKPPVIDSPSEVQARHLTLQNLGQRNQLGAQQLQLGEQQKQENTLTLRSMAEKQRTEAERLDRARRVRDALATAPNEATALEQVGAIDPEARFALEKNFAARRAEERKQVEFSHALRQDVGQSLYAVLGEKDAAKRPALYKVQLERLAANPAYKDVVKELPPEMPEEAVLNSSAMSLLSVEDQRKIQESEDSKLALPEYLAKRFGYEAGRKVSPSTVGTLTHWDAYRQGIEDRAEAREDAAKNPKPSSTHVIQDDAGNVSAVSIMPSGEVKSKAVPGVKGRATKETPARGQMTDAQRQQRYEEIEREEYGYNGRPGLHDTLKTLGRLLTEGKETIKQGNKTKSIDLTDEDRAKRIEALLAAARARADQQERSPGREAGG